MGYSWFVGSESERAQFLIQGIICRVSMAVGVGPELDTARNALVMLDQKSLTPRQAIAMAEEVNVAVM